MCLKIFTVYGLDLLYYGIGTDGSNVLFVEDLV